MDKKVTVLTPNGRRQNVKVTPNTTLLQILEEACQKHGFDSDTHCLKHHNKEVGLTQLFRFSGLPNNCLLEMYETERKRVQTNVDICVQLEDGTRFQRQFMPSDNLWYVAEQLCGAELAASFASPVVLYMRQEFVGKERMSAATLKSLGITEGRAMLRFIDKNPEELKTQANVYIAPVAKETPQSEEKPVRALGSKTHGAGGFAITKELVQSLKQASTVANTSAEEDSAEQQMDANTSASNSDESKENEKPKYDWGSGSGRTMRDSETNVAAREHLETEMEVEEPEVNIIGDRNAILYSLDAMEKQIEDLPDSFFDLTVQDLKLVLRDLKKIAAGNEDAPLLTEKLRELEDSKTMLNKLGQYKNCVIRVQFPDRHVLQGMFKPIDKIDDVSQFVRKFLQNQQSKFHLFTIPPKTVLGMDKTLLELDFVPTAVLHFAWEEEPMENSNENFIKTEFLSKLTSAEGAFYAANKFRISNRSTAKVEANNNDNFATYEHKSPGPSTGAIPKRPRNEDLKN